MQNSHLKLSISQTGLLVVRPHRNKVLTFLIPPLLGQNLTPCPTDKSLGVILDADLTLDAQITAICKSSNVILHSLKQIVPFVPPFLRHFMTGVLINSKLDYANSLLLGSPGYQMNHLQLVQNWAARMATGLSLREHVMEAMHNLPWLQVKDRVIFKALCLTHRAFFLTRVLSIYESFSASMCQPVPFVYRTLTC